MPLIAVFMPLDAAASVMDGVLLGSQEAGWMSRTMAVTSFFCG
jgi:Na+-driven multidrug efflux pump